MKLSTRLLVLTPLFSALTIAGAFIRIPFPLAPLTLQTLFAMMAGFILGPKAGALSQLLYIIIGLTGVPIFAYGGGMGYLLNPTFGFLLGFIPMAYVSGMIYQNRRTLQNAVAGGILGTILLYAIGLPYLYIIFNYHLSVQKTVWDVIKGAMLIFLPGDILKLLLGAYLSTIILKRIRYL
jgi:biotin transport system substrate-specific component